MAGGVRVGEAASEENETEDDPGQAHQNESPSSHALDEPQTNQSEDEVSQSHQCTQPDGEMIVNSSRHPEDSRRVIPKRKKKGELITRKGR